jgi:hypothetical protein
MTFPLSVFSCHRSYGFEYKLRAGSKYVDPTPSPKSLRKLSGRLRLKRWSSTLHIRTHNWIGYVHLHLEMPTESRSPHSSRFCLPDDVSEIITESLRATEAVEMVIDTAHSDPHPTIGNTVTVGSTCGNMIWNRRGKRWVQ